MTTWIESLESRQLLAAQPIVDLTPGTDGSAPVHFRSAAGAVYFLAGYNNALYRTDGTSAGTQLIGEFGTTSSISALNPWRSGFIDNTLIFEIEGKVYRTNGAAGQWEQLADFGQRYYVGDFQQSADTVYFTARPTPGATPLLYAVGKSGAPVAIANLYSGGYTSYSHELLAIGADEFFVDSAGQLAWHPGLQGAFPLFTANAPSNARGFLNVNGTFYFAAQPAGTSDFKLYRFDPQSMRYSGPELVPNTPVLSLPTSNGNSVNPGYMANMGGQLYFLGASAQTPNNFELWRTDGTTDGTQLVLDVDQSTLTSSNIRSMTVAGDRLYFVSDGDLWVSDGTSIGTVRLSTTLRGDTNLDQMYNWNGPVNLTAGPGRRIYFVASNTSTNTGIELYTSDGTVAGTRLAADVNPTGNGLYNGFWTVRRPSELAVHDGAVFFAGNNGVGGASATFNFEPWIYRREPAASIQSIDAAEGSTVTLQGSGQSDNGSITLYEWDFNYDGTFNADATGQNPQYTVGDGLSQKTIVMRVTDSAGLVSLITRATITVSNVAPTATFNGSTVTLGAASGVAFTNATDPSAADTAAGFKYSYDFNNDGDFIDAGDIANSTLASASFTFAATGTYTVRGRIADKDGGFRNYTTTVNVTEVQTPPTSPANLVGQATAGDRVQLNWTDRATNETGFEIQRSTAFNYSPAFTSTLNTPNATGFLQTGLNPRTWYYFRVRAINAAGPSAWSNSVKIKTLAGGSVTPTIPAAPTSPSATADSSSQITVRWTDASSNESGFRIRRSLTADFASFVDFTVGAGVTSFVNTGLAANTLYYYRVQSYNAAGSSAFTSTVSAKTPTTGVTPVLNAPTNLTATPGRTTMQLNWLDNALGETGYQVQISTVYNYTPATTLILSGSNLQSHLVTGLNASTWYYFRVRATDGSAFSGWSNSLKVKTLA